MAKPAIHQAFSQPINVSVYCPGYVNTEIDNAERSRPTRFASSSSDTLNPEMRKEFRRRLDAGVSIEKSADIVFTAIQKNKFYIGVQVFSDQLVGLEKMIRNRAESIINETHPELAMITPPEEVKSASTDE